jgi:hypothetical protein
MNDDGVCREHRSTSCEYIVRSDQAVCERHGFTLETIGISFGHSYFVLRMTVLDVARCMKMLDLSSALAHDTRTVDVAYCARGVHVAPCAPSAHGAHVYVVLMLLTMFVVLTCSRCSR